jgi:hypothetical protein
VPALAAIPPQFCRRWQLVRLASLAWCALDRQRRVQDWLVQRASWKVAVVAGGVFGILLEMLARVDAQIPFVYFQF